MAPRKEMTSLRMDPDLLAGLRKVKDRDGIPVSVQVHRAVETWLRSKGVSVKATSRRAPTRRKV